MPPTAADGQGGGIGVPLPDSDDPEMGGSVANVAPQPPWQSIPKFIPGTTNVQEYVQKLKFLASMWPTEHLALLAPRAALLVEGTAFKKVARLPPEKLKVANQSGIALLVDAIGGSWGSTELEERYEHFERALYGTVQRQDESHDSFLSRMESSFVELLTRGTTLEEVQAYVLLRQSTLPADDKKRILLEHEGDLRYKPVVKSFRLLGSKFFAEFQSGKSSNKTKVYDVHHSEAMEPDHAENHDRAYHTATEDFDLDLDFETIEALAAQEDSDAMTVCAFENELEEFLQETPEMHDAMTTYLEARNRLLEKRKNRGFWPTKGRGKSAKGKYKGKQSRSREQLLARIARSHCRKCGAVGHWKAECPLNVSDKNQSQASATANVAFDDCVTHDQEVYSEVEDVKETQAGFGHSSCPPVLHETCFMALEHVSASDRQKLQDRMVRFMRTRGHKGDKIGDNLGNKKDNNLGKIKPSVPGSKSVCPKFVHPNRALSFRKKPPEILMQPPMIDDKTDGTTTESIMLSSAAQGPTCAILDTGASRCIIGEKTLKLLQSHLPTDVSSKLKTSPSQVKFRFGNEQSLTSSYRIHFPLKAVDRRTVWLAVEVVPGGTPFLLSKRAFKMLGGLLDAVQDICYMKRLHHEPIPLNISNTGLYLSNVGDLCQGVSNLDDQCLQAYVGDSCHGEHSKHAGGHGKKYHPVFRHFADQPNKNEQKFNFANKAISDPSVPPNAPDRNPTRSHAVGGEPVQGCGRIPDSGDDNAAADAHSASRVELIDQLDGRSPHGDRPADPDHDGRTAISACSSGEPQPPATDPNRDVNSCQSGDAQTRLQGQDVHGSQVKPGSDRFSRISKTDHVDQLSCTNDVVSRGIRQRCFCGRGRRVGDCPSSSTTSASHDADPKGSAFRRMGHSLSDLGKEAQGQELRSHDPSGSTVLRLVPEPLPVADSGDAGLCALRPDASEPIGSPARDRRDRSLEDSTFHDQVMLTRQELTQNPPSHVLSSELFESICKAESTFDQHIMDCKWKTDATKDRVFLLEIYAGKDSPLTEAVKRLGLPSCRFTREDGDLSTISGRAKLWHVIETCQPEHIWVAPECGPWSGWNRLNQQKSVALFDMIQQKQYDQLPHVQLCARLCKYQTDRNRHFHLEQPRGSGLLQLEILHPIFQHVLMARVDMCRFGLKIPKTNRFLRKSSVILTTSIQMHEKLDCQNCPQNHLHQPIEGSFHHQGVSTKMTHFCATYCQGFARTVAKYLCQLNHSVCLPQDAHVNDIDSEEPPAKRARFSFSLAKRRKLEQPIDLDPTVPDVRFPRVEPDNKPEMFRESNPNESEKSQESQHPWFAVMQLAQSIAPRVGNTRCSADSEAFQKAQELLPNMQVESMFVCRGTERYQVPVLAPASHDCPIRHTICWHRHDNQIHDLGPEDWHSLTRARRIRSCLPSRLTITIFGSRKISEAVSMEAPEAPAPSAERQPEEAEPASAIRVRQLEHLPRAVTERTSNQVCEGWAPPPIALHGPKFRLLSENEKNDLVKLHKNLGHPDPEKLAAHLQAQGARLQVIEAAREFVCDACVESSAFRHQRPAQLHDPSEFNDFVGIDGFFWSGKAGFQVMVFHCIDEASLFHLGRRLDNRNLEHVIPAFSDMWLSWAGNPTGIYSDPAGEFCSDEWLSFLQGLNIVPKLSTEAWQKGRVERHGALIKEMLNRYDAEKVISSTHEFDTVLRACFQAKNSLSRHQGFSPEQIVLGKATRVPASLTADESLGAHSMAVGDDLACERFRQQLEIRSLARKTFLATDNDQAIRRALLRRSCPPRGPFHAGQLVMYWRRPGKPNRREGGRWYGPARVVSQESSSVVWVAHAHKLLRCSPESLRPASLREWQGNQTLEQSIQSCPKENPDQPSQRIEAPENLDNAEYSPGTLLTFDQAPNSHQTSIQPESEVFPEIPNNPSQQATSDADQSVHDESVEPTVEIVEPPDDPPAEDDEDESLHHDHVFWCQDVKGCPMDQPLHEWLTYQPGTETPEVCLAEDEMPILDQPLEHFEDQCFMLEVPMSKQDLIKWSTDPRPQELACVASASKRARAEVQIKDLSSEDRRLFDLAKDAELNCWLQTSALKPVLRKSLNPDQILRSRWVLTWKPVEDQNGKVQGRKAKARLVVLGYMDPQLTEVARDAPTLTKEGRHTILQMIASRQWALSSFDIRTAFLRGRADDANPLAMEPPKELRQKLQLREDQVCSLIGNAYGRVDAPLLFYRELALQLKKLGFRVHPLEPCVHYLESWKGDVRTLHGIIGTHVDDGICGGDEFFHKQLQKLREVLPFGAFKQRKFTFTGIQLEQLPDYSIVASQKDYIYAIPALEIGKHRRNLPEQEANESEKSSLRAIIGSLQYAVTHTRPDLAARLGEIQTQIARPTVNTLLMANKLLREAQETSDTKIFIRSIPVGQVTHVVFGDASFASPKQLSSFQGTIVFATTPELQQNLKAPISPLTWSSKKIARVVRSTLSAEAFSMSRGVDKLSWMRLLWGTIAVDNFDWRQPPKALATLHKAIIVTDCKSLYDLVTRTAMPSCEEYRPTLEVLLIRELCHENCFFRWIPTSLQLADPLTKPMDPVILRIALESGSFQLFDGQASLQTNAHRKQAVTWLKGQEPGVSHQKKIPGV